MRKLTEEQLVKVNGGGTFYDWYTDIRNFVNNSLGDLIRGIKDGWKSK